MDERFLPKMLLAVARRRAAERGFASVSEYVGELIREDLGKRAATAGASSAAKRGLGRRRRRESVAVIRKRLLDGMFSHMKASEEPGFGYACGYALKHVDRCAAITRDFLERLSAVPKGEGAKIMAEVKRVVVRLNKLNASCNGALIETDQREDLCLLIRRAADEAGLGAEGDVTEQWREW